MENLKSKEEYKTTITQPFITAEELKMHRDFRSAII
jgi:hypothetical protein